MKLRRHANSLAFSKIFANSVVTRVLFWYTLFGVKYSVRGLVGVDSVFSARCEAKCLNKPESIRIQCAASCLNGSWNKPGTCPSSETESVPNSENTAITFCKSDIECFGMLKCCQHASNNTCQPAQLGSATGLTAIPTDLMATILRNPQEEEKAKVLIRWSPVNTTNVDELVIYIIEECHHYGKLFVPARLTKWIELKRTSHTSMEYRNIGEAGRWIQFRVSAVNENGTVGPSAPTSPLYASSLPKVPRAPESLKVSATSWGNGRLHVLLTWSKPASEAPIDRYKVTWSVLKNLTLSEHHYTLPSTMTNFWLHNFEPVTEYFVHVRAQASFGRKKLLGKQASMVFKATNQSEASEHVKEEKGLDLKFKRHVKNLLVENVYWLHDQLLAMVSWRPVKKNVATNYSVSWSHENCSSPSKTRFIARTVMTNMEIYGLLPECNYKVSVKGIWEQTLYSGFKIFSTHGCRRNESILHSIITNCS